METGTLPQQRWLMPGDELSDAFAVRINVFCQEQGYTVEMEIDDIDPVAEHLVLYDQRRPVATGRLFLMKEGVYGIGRVAVLCAYRGQGLGGVLLSLLMERAQARGAVSLELDAQCRAIPFYERYGFRECGPEHLDGDIPHKKMRKTL
ncbi:MAG: GNAT family N-acetyltransferase [Clostridiales bacterium]|nr:GNAT family N-acetyltransferase [Clostridiales bacterium]